MANKTGAQPEPDRPGQQAFRDFANGVNVETTFDKALPEILNQIKKYLIFYDVPGNDLEDFAQDVYLRVLDNRERLIGRGKPAVLSWLKTVSRNIIRDKQRKMSRQFEATGWMAGAQSGVVYESAVALIPRECREQEIKDREAACAIDPVLLDALEHCTESLPDRNRKIFRLRYLNDQEVKEIAELFKLSPRAIQTILAAARESVAECLRSQGFEDII